ncbi:MAG: cysteine synthase A [Myxococcales bacterium]|nr:cysteine synthase A [Myxococcales bacterium]
MNSDETPMIADSVLELIGRTPVLRLKRMPALGSAEVLVKLESQSPGGSVKDRVALHMILAAEADGRLRPGTVVVEPSSGNTGIGLAMVCAVRGYRCIIVMPDSMSLERIAILERFGAEVVLTKAADDMAGAVKKGKEIARSLANAFMPAQFENPANPAAHEGSTALEILSATGGKLDAFVAAVGTGGTITGVGTVLKAKLPSVRLIAVEPESSPVLSGGKARPHKIQGIGAGFVPSVLRRELIDEIRTVSDRSAFDRMKELAAREGILAGLSGGANVHVALAVAAELGQGARVMTMICDSGERYLSVQHYFEL